MPSPNPAKRTERSRDQEEEEAAHAATLLLCQMHVVPYHQNDEALAAPGPLMICKR